jgi:hypothetical protein
MDHESKRFRFAPLIILASFVLDATSPAADEVTTKPSFSWALGFS